MSCVNFGEFPLSGIGFGSHALAAVSQQIEVFFLRPNCLHMLTNGLLVLSKLAERRRKFEKELGRGAECILNDASETKVAASIEVILSPTDHPLHPGPNYAKPLMPARSVNRAAQTFKCEVSTGQKGKGRNQEEGDAWKERIGFLRCDDGLFGSDKVLEWS